MYTAYKVTFEDTEVNPTGFFCELCKFPLRTHQDFFYKKSFCCCHECYLTFAESRKQLWKDGWRPDKTTVEEYIYNRKQSILGEKNEL